MKQYQLILFFLYVFPLTLLAQVADKDNTPAQNITSEIHDKKNTLEAIESDIKNSSAYLQSLEDRVTKFADSLQILRYSFTAFVEKHKLESTTDSLEKTKERLRQETIRLRLTMDSLNLVKSELVGTRNKLDNKRLWVNILIGALALLAVIIIFTQHQRIQTARRIGMELRKRRREIEEKNRELEEKGIRLENYVERLKSNTKELNHRTKNNLQNISAMLLLQSKKTPDPEARESLSEARGRIDVLGILHKQLYKTERENYTQVEINDYVTALTQHLVSVNMHHKKEPNVELSIEKKEVKMEHAVHIGLIINELVQNSFKHAFPKVKTPELKIILFHRNDHTHITVRDNGPGLPPDLDLARNGSFGLELVNTITEGLEGTLKAYNNDGAVFEIIIPCPPSDEPE
jgi:two-component sensor histidine kinase